VVVRERGDELKSKKKIPLKRHPPKVLITKPSVLATAHEKVIYQLCSEAVLELHQKIKNRGYKLDVSDTKLVATISSLQSNILFDLPLIWSLYAKGLENK
jgi:hypothetical protein